MPSSDWPSTRATVAYLDRPITKWSLEDALATIRSPEPGGPPVHQGRVRLRVGINPHNAGDAIQYLIGGNNPSTEARVPIEGMDRIPRALAARFEERGGIVALGKDVRRVAMDDGIVRLEFADGSAIAARRLVLAIPVPALAALVNTSPIFDGPAWRHLLRSAMLRARPKLGNSLDFPERAQRPGDLPVGAPPCLARSSRCPLGRDPLRANLPVSAVARQSETDRLQLPRIAALFGRLERHPGARQRVPVRVAARLEDA